MSQTNKNEQPQTLRTELGRIKSIKIGHGGYQDACFGVTFDLGARGWGVHDFWGGWSPAIMQRPEGARWTEADREANLLNMVTRLDALLKEAGVSDANALVGLPVEVTFKNHTTLHSWRLLTEVLP